METVLLAAGLSTRMHGSQKLLLPWGDETVAAHCVRQALFGLRDILMASPTAPEQSAGRLIVVTGCDAVPVRKALEPIEGQLEAGLFDVQSDAAFLRRPELLFVHNQRYCFGQFSSTLAGVAVVSQGSPFFITMGDLPLITAAHYGKLVGQLDGYDAVRPACAGTPGHPVLHAARLREEILKLPETATMRSLLAVKKTTATDDGDIAWISDIDTPEAYRSLYVLTFGRLPS